MDCKDLKELQTSLKEAAAYMASQVKSENAIVFFGYTKSGKSTLLNYIIGNELKGERVSEFKAYSISKVKNSNGPEIGLEASSKTITPTRWDNPEELPGLALWDLPGYDDNRGAVQDITGAYYIYEIFKSVRSMKIVLVIDINDVLNNRINSFINLLHSVEMMLNGKMSECFSSIVVIFTKVKKMINNGPATKERIGKIMNHQVLSCSDMDISETVKEYVRYLINNHENIGLFKAAESERITNEIEVDIMKSIKNASSIKENILKSVTPSISINSKNELNLIRQRLYSIEEFNDFQTTVNSIFNDDLEKFEKIRENEISPDVLHSTLNQLTAKQNELQNVLDSESSFHDKIDIFKTMVPEINKKHNVDNLLEMAYLMKFVDSLLNFRQSEFFDERLKHVIHEIVLKIDKIIVDIKLKLKEIDRNELEEHMEKTRKQHSIEMKNSDEKLKKITEEFKSNENNLKELLKQTEKAKEEYANQAKNMEKKINDVHHELKLGEITKKELEERLKTINEKNEQELKQIKNNIEEKEKTRIEKEMIQKQLAEHEERIKNDRLKERERMEQISRETDEKLRQINIARKEMEDNKMKEINERHLKAIERMESKFEEIKKHNNTEEKKLGIFGGTGDMIDKTIDKTIDAVKEAKNKIRNFFKF